MNKQNSGFDMHFSMIKVTVPKVYYPAIVCYEKITNGADQTKQENNNKNISLQIFLCFFFF